MSADEKSLVWLHGEIKTPPFSKIARIQTGYFLRCLQQGEKLSMPHSRPMPSIGTRCHELRINDVSKTWRIIYRIDSDAIIILDVFEKKTRQTPKNVMAVCQKRIRTYEADLE